MQAAADPGSTAVPHPAREALPAGLADPVADAQSTFRALLDALARPGRAIEVPCAAMAAGGDGAAAALGLMPATVAILLALADADSPVWWQHPTPLRARWLRFHAGAATVTDRRSARFAIVEHAAALPSLDGFAPGSDALPDDSATLLVEVASFAGGPERTWSGPGLAAPTRIALPGLPDTFWPDWMVQHARFPCGVDVVFVAGARVLGLPRTVAVEGRG